MSSRFQCIYSCNRAWALPPQEKEKGEAKEKDCPLPTQHARTCTLSRMATYRLPPTAYRPLSASTCCVLPLPRASRARHVLPRMHPSASSSSSSTDRGVVCCAALPPAASRHTAHSAQHTAADSALCQRQQSDSETAPRHATSTAAARSARSWRARPASSCASPLRPAPSGRRSSCTRCPSRGW
jgi:hypothetical protein